MAIYGKSTVINNQFIGGQKWPSVIRKGVKSMTKLISDVNDMVDLTIEYIDIFNGNIIIKTNDGVMKISTSDFNPVIETPETITMSEAQDLGIDTLET